MSALRVILLAVLVLIGVGVTAYLSGRSDGKASVKLEQNTAQLDTNKVKLDTATVHESRTAERSASELKAREPIVKERAALRKRMTVEPDGTVAIDSQPPILVPPEVIQLIGISDQLIRQDSITIAALRVQVASLERTNALLRERVQLLETRVDLVKGPRCGMKCGIALGATGTLALLYGLASVVR